MPSGLLDVRGVATHVVRAGRGHPLLVLHPELAADHWTPFHDALARSFRVIAPDHPGFGRSERPEWLDGIDDLVLHYVDLLDQLELDRVNVVGTSLGGWIAAALAVHHPERIHRLVLCAAAGIRVDGVERYDLFAKPLAETAAQLFFDPSRAAQLVPRSPGPETLRRLYRESTTLARLAWDPYLYDSKLTERLGRIRAPTLVIWGERDRILPPAHGEAYASGIPGARLEMVPDCGHLPPYERADDVAARIRRFLEGDG